MALYVAAMAGLVLLPVGTLLRFSGCALGLLAVGGEALSDATKALSSPPSLERRAR